MTECKYTTIIAYKILIITLEHNNLEYILIIRIKTFFCRIKWVRKKKPL